MKSVLFRASGTLAIVAALTFIAFAQQPATPAPGGDSQGQEQHNGFHRRMRRHHYNRMEMMALHHLNLTPEQKEQLRLIRENHKAKRTEMRQLYEQKRQGTITPEGEAKLQEFQNMRQQMRDEMLAVLTPEQRTQLDQLREQHREKMRQMRDQRQQQNQTNPQ